MHNAFPEGLYAQGYIRLYYDRSRAAGSRRWSSCMDMLVITKIGSRRWIFFSPAMPT